MAEIIVALDVPSGEEALHLVDRLGPELTFVKVGMELFTREGAPVIQALRQRDLRIFLDLKLHDIPNTVSAAVRSASALGVELLTVHASGGRRMMEAAARARERPLRLLAVTVLTSFDSGELSEAWGRDDADPAAEVRRLSDLARGSGLDGVVCSPLEAASLRERHGADFGIVTPGIRPSGSPVQDQRRVATPSDAVRAGATHLVVGRAITAAPDPAEALDLIRGEVLGVAAGGVR